MPTLDATTERTLARFDALDLSGPGITEIADLLRYNGASHLSVIERIELAERLITRRRFLIGAGALVLAGCGAPGASAPTAMVGATRQITDDLGRMVDVPAEPQRVVMLDPSRSTVHLVELGIVPLAATHNNATKTETSLFPAILGDAAQQMTSIGLIGTANLEQITTLRPDLILYNMPYQDIEVDLLAAIAPTVAYEFRPSFEEHLRFIASVVGRTAQAEELIADFERQLDTRAERLQLNGRRMSLPLIFSEAPAFSLWGPESLLGRSLTRLGAQIVPGTISNQPLTDSSDELSLEVIPELVDADTIILQRYTGTPEWEENVQTILTSPIWQSIPASSAAI